MSWIRSLVLRWQKVELLLYHFREAMRSIALEAIESVKLGIPELELSRRRLFLSETYAER